MLGCISVGTWAGQSPEAGDKKSLVQDFRDGISIPFSSIFQDPGVGHWCGVRLSKPMFSSLHLPFPRFDSFTCFAYIPGVFSKSCHMSCS